MSGQQEVRYLESAGVRRRYVLYRPEAVQSSSAPVPALVMLDGRGGTPWTAMRTALWNNTADRGGFAVIYPEALRLDPEGPQHFLTNPQMWCAGTGGSDVERNHVDDVGFLAQTIHDAVAYANLDGRSIFMAGFSNGAAMTYRFALEQPRMLAGIASVSGHLRAPPDAVLSEPVPLISFFGEQDPLSPADGGEVDLPWGRREYRPPAFESVRRWAVLCGHRAEDLVATRAPGVVRWSCGRPGQRDEIKFVTVSDLGHVWPGGHRILPESLVGHGSDRVKANEEIWDFFAARIAGIR